MMVSFALLLITTVAIVSVLCALKLIQKRTKRDNRKRKIYPPIAGMMFHQLLNFNRYHDYLTDITRKYKTFRLVGPFYDEIFTADPVNVEYILKTNFSNYGKGWFSSFTKELFGEGIFVVDGEKWRQQRKLASFEFTTKVLRDFSSVIFKNNAVKLAEKISEAASTNKVIDMQDLFLKATMDSIFEVAFGLKLNCLSGEDDEGVRFANAFDDSSMQVMWRFVNPFWIIMRFLNVGSEATFKANIKLIDDFIYKLISTKANRNTSRLTVEREEILSRFLLQSEKDPEKMNSKYLRDMILNFVIAGKDTTAGSLSWFLYMLCKNPHVQDKVATEVKEATKSNSFTSFSEYATSITEDAISKMQYLHATLSETLRLYPAVSSDSKVCFLDDELPDGFSVRKGDVVTYQPYPMGRMTYIWGKDAEVFRPERWLDENGMFCPENPFKFPAFQAGPRICLGKEFAYRQMKIFAAVLLRFFRFKLNDDKKAVTYRTMLTLHIDQGLHLHASKRG